jgi:hypothetical protein
LTKKHQKKMPKIEKPLCKFSCKQCLRTYKDRTGLWKHRKKCLATEPDTPPCEKPAPRQEAPRQEAPRQEAPRQEEMLGNMFTLIYDLVKQNQEIKDLLLKQQEQLIEHAKRPTIIHNHTTTMTTTTNNHAHISFNVFLQEKCKYAMNLNEFVDNLKVQTCDVEMVGRVGFVEGISRIIMNGLSLSLIHI